VANVVPPTGGFLTERVFHSADKPDTHESVAKSGPAAEGTGEVDPRNGLRTAGWVRMRWSAARWGTLEESGAAGFGRAEVRNPRE
jgi:hypothetical protein